MSEFIFHDISQNTDEWHDLRAGLVTSSNLKLIMANYGKAFGEPAKNYAKRIANERVTGKPTRGSYKSEAMERGHIEEPMALIEYEKTVFADVSNGGFFQGDDRGCSPDGLVDDGVVEFKSADSHIHYDRIKRQSYDPNYKWQCLGNMKWTGREWIDFVSLCTDYPKGKRLYIYRMFKKDFEDELRKMNKRVGEFLGLVDECEKNIRSLNYVILEPAREAA